MATSDAVPVDYDSNPARYRLGALLARSYSSANLYARVASCLTETELVLDVGCAEGVLRAELRGPTLIGLDVSAELLKSHPAPKVRADATRIPFQDNTFDAVTTLNMLYHLADPAQALKEARRVLKSGGVLIAATIARADSPEFAAYHTRNPSTFDAEEAPDIVTSVFGNVEVDAWDAPLATLRTQESVRDYLLTRHVDETTANKAAEELEIPLTVTKRGALLIARKPA